MKSRNTEGGIVSLQPDGSAFIMLTHPRACICGRIVALVLNRDGKTRCTVCDDLYQNATPRKP